MIPTSRLRGKWRPLFGIFLPLGLLAGLLMLVFSAEPEGTAVGAQASLARAPAPEVSPPPAHSAAKFGGLVESQSIFAWPATGPLTSYVGPGHPTGIDIGFSYNEDSLVRAARAGVVTFAGGSTCCDYGLHVEIEHEDGWSTRYAHFSKIGVEVGQAVEQGYLLGLGGATGFADGKHLHFEIMKDEEFVDPLRYLPPEQVLRRPPSVFSCPDNAMTIDPASRTSIRFTSEYLAGFRLVSAAVEPANPGQGEPAITPSSEAGLNLALEAEAAATPSGKAFDYNLELSFASENETEDINCTLRLKTMQSFPTMVRVTRPIPTPTRRPTWTPTAIPPASTATRIPTSTPRVSTPTPSAPAPAATRSSGGTSATPRPPPTSTPRR